MSRKAPLQTGLKLPKDARVAIVAARFNGEIVDELLAGCVAQLKKMGATPKQIDVHRVPGAFEIPLAAKVLAASKKVQAVICLGCVIRGDTPHFDFVAGECARGIQIVSITEKIPVIFGVLTTNTEKQAWDRAGGKHSHAGRNAASAAVEMIVLLQSI